MKDKKIYFVLIMILFMLSGCKESTEEIINLEKDEDGWIVYDDSIIYSLDSLYEYDNYFLNVPDWNYEDKNDIRIYTNNNKNIVLAIKIGYENNYNETLKSSFKEINNIKEYKVNKNESSNDIEKGTIIFNNKDNGNYVLYNFNYYELNGSIICYGLESIDPDLINGIVSEMIESVNMYIN